MKMVMLMSVQNVMMTTLSYLVSALNYKIVPQLTLLTESAHNVKMDITLIGISKTIKR